MYTVTIVSKEIIKERNLLKLTVSINDGENTEQKVFDLPINYTLNQIKAEVKAYIDNLESAKSTVASIPTGTFDYTPQDPAPSADDIAESAWFQNWNKLLFADRLIAAGVLTGNEAQYTALKNKVKTDFKTEYLG